MTAGIGHNSGGVDAEGLKSFVDRIETLEIQKSDIGDDIKNVYAEAKLTGYDVKIIRILLRERKMSPDERDERDQVLDLYRQALDGLD